MTGPSASIEHLLSRRDERHARSHGSGTQDRQTSQHLHREFCTIKDAAFQCVAVGDASDYVLVMSLFSHIGDVHAFFARLERFWTTAPPPRE
jgi:hypothetical protein